MAFMPRVLEVKRIFRVSYRTVLYRLAEQSRDKSAVWKRFQGDYKRLQGKTLLKREGPAALAASAFRASSPEPRRAGEPENLSPLDFQEDRLARLVRRAVEAEEISLGRAAEILDLPLQQMRELSRSWVA